MAKNRPTKEMFGQVMRKPIPFRKDTTTGIESLDEAIDWLAEDRTALLDIAVAKEAVPLLMAATRIGAHVTACHEDQGFTAAIKQSFLIHRIRNHTLINKNIRALPGRFKRSFDALLALDLSTQNMVEKALELVGSALDDEGKALISGKKDVFSETMVESLGDQALTGTYESAGETYVFVAFTKKAGENAV